MIARRYRFHGYNSLKSVYGRGQNARSGVLSLKYASRDSNRNYRVGVVVSKKVHKSAVVRNRIRRRIYEAVRRSSNNLNAGSDLVFTAYDAQIATMDSAKLENIVENLLQKSANPNP